MSRIKTRALGGAALALGVAVAAGSAAAQPAPGRQDRLPTVRLSAGMFYVEAEVAQTFAQRQHGLMGREKMGPLEGMLFVFEQPSTQCFWMKNTPLPLSIAFLADDGRIVNIADMKPFDDRSQHCSAEPVRYALEMNQGFFAQRGLKPGSKLGGSPFR